MMMAQSARRINRSLNGTLLAAFVPALLLSLVLGAALVFKLSHLGGRVTSNPAMVQSPAGLEFPHHSPAPSVAGISVPGEWLAGGVSTHHTATARPVAEQLAARAADVEFCVGSTLEPFDAAWAQLAAIGPDEAAERTRRCLMELVFTHVDPATADNVRAQLPAFSACYQQAAALSTPNKAEAMAEITGCLTTLPGRAN